MEWSALVLLVVARAGGAAGLQWSATCGGAVGLRLSAAPDVPARYTAQWCSVEAARRRVLQWSLKVFVETDRDAEAPGAPRCHGDPAHRQVHSLLTEDINQQYDCDEGQPLCFSADLDLLYSGCYVVQSRASLAGADTSMTEQELFLNNSVPNADLYIHSQPMIDYLYGDPTVVHWSFGHIPVTDFKIDLEKVLDGSAEIVTVSADNCSVPAGHRSELRCALWVAPGRYEVLLEHTAPWTRGAVFPRPLKTLTNVLELSPRRAEPVTAGADYRGAAGCAAGGGAALALLLLLLVKRRWALSKLRKHVKQAWFRTDSPGGLVPATSDGATDGTQVLLLYARDCAPLMAAAAELRALFELATLRQVFDLHCPRTLAAIAPNPADWLRRAVSDPRVTVVLLETPAARMLYAPLSDNGQVSAPLLGTRVLYRAPTPGDTLLLLTLQLVQTAALQLDNHHRLYIATIDASSSVVPHSQQYRRYPLPGGAERLIQHVCGHTLSSPPAPLAALRASLDLLQQYVRERPDYLRDELLFL